MLCLSRFRQLEKQSWQTRNQLRTVSGDTFWLSVPIERVSGLRKPLFATSRSMPTPNCGTRKHLASSQTSLGRAPHFDEDLCDRRKPGVERGHPASRRSQYIAHNRICARARSRRKVRACDRSRCRRCKTELVTNICRALGATRYYSPASSSIYLEPEAVCREQHRELVFQRQGAPDISASGCRLCVALKRSGRPHECRCRTVPRKLIDLGSFCAEMPFHDD